MSADTKSGKALAGARGRALGEPWTAADVRDALRRRHAATQGMGIRTVPGPWTCIEELLSCDLVAFAAHQRPANGSTSGVKYPRVGYEVKVSRADLRTELLSPSKRAEAVGNCHEFYIATPKNLLSIEEKAWQQPEWAPDAFRRSDCTNRCFSQGRRFYVYDDGNSRVLCPICPGRGWLERSLAEREAPTLWIPPDVGLIEVTRNGSHIVKASPVNRAPKTVDNDWLGVLVRFVSAHPDPRHDGIVEADRVLSKELRSRERRYA